jgi:hypothetical protein
MIMADLSFETMIQPSRFSEPLAGSKGSYQWLSSEQSLGDLVKVCPEAVLRKYIAVISFDSGLLVPSAEELAIGWKSRQGIAYSPLIQSVESLPHDLYDEWYVFDQPVDLGTSRLGSNIFDPPLRSGEVGDFVNYNFALHMQERNSLADLFWSQLDWIHPESYIADNDYLTFATRDQSLFSSVVEALRNMPSDPPEGVIG